MKSLLKEHFLKNISLKDEQWNFISKHFHSKKFKKKEYIINKDEVVTEIYFIKSGLVKLYVDDLNGNENIISFA
ncbi:cyclic nucleotide-binding domain-containing protein [Epilithonimonas hispanica]|uniref:cyclic nucleotide-binding domain-containing protein n=1 Tax=Epilithonimonas hispanica TaxID=358687 RepID=UPI001300A4BE|nr:cyclic nucleotide-binding domain-containing protein [Epilithonimonas hispanica]